MTDFGGTYNADIDYLVVSVWNDKRDDRTWAVSDAGSLHKASIELQRRHGFTFTHVTRHPGMYRGNVVVLQGLRKEEK